MKKIIAFVLLALTMLMLVGCSFKCDICQQEKSGGKHTEEVLGEEIVYCEDCYEAIKSAGDLFD